MNGGVKNKYQVRKNTRIEFVKQYSDLIMAAGFSKQGHMSEEGKTVIQKARELIGYSHTYVNLDIYRSLYNLHKEICC